MVRHAPSVRSLARLRLALMLIASGISMHAALAQSAPVERVSTPVDPAWLAPLEDADRAELDRVVGYAAPTLPLELGRWRNARPLTMDQLRGRVVIIQSLSTASGRGLMTNRAITTAMEPLRDRATLILLHTPDIRPTLEDRIKSWKLEDPLIVDRDGSYCDALGVFRTPVSLVIDRHGIIRAAGLTPDGAAALAAQLADEPYVEDRHGTLIPRRSDGAADDRASYPPITGAIGNAEDIRGKRVPMLNISEWLTEEPALTDRVLVIDFWATWCAPCVRGIPKLNELQRQFGDRIVIIGLTGESRTKLANGMNKIKLEYSDFEYAVARDQGSETQVAIRLASIPHALVVSRDGIVRWQGHPQNLTPEILEQTIRADGGQSLSGRWATELVRRAREASRGPRKK